MSEAVEIMNIDTMSPTYIEAANKCLQRIESAIHTANVAFYDISVSLLEAYENNYAQTWGFANFSDFVEQKLDMKYRSAYYMMNIGRAIRQLELSKERVERIGWSKLKEISGVLMHKPYESEKYLQMAETMSKRQLVEAIQLEDLKLKKQEEEKKILRLSCQFEEGSSNIIAQALTQAYDEIGQTDPSLAIAHILGEWMQMRNDTTHSPTLEDWLAYLHKTFGVTLVRATEEENLDSILN